MKTPVRILLTLFVLAAHTHCARVLFVPGEITSLCIESMSVGMEMLKRGHHVTLFAHIYDLDKCMSRFNISNFKQSFKIVSPQLTHEMKEHLQKKIDSGLETMMDGSLGVISFCILELRPFMQTLCTIALSDQTLLEELKEDKYDLAVVDALPTYQCLFAIPVHLGIPYAGKGSYIDPVDARLPLQSITLPNMFSEYTNEMDFGQRLISTFIWFLNPVLRVLMNPSLEIPFITESLRGRDIKDLIKDSVLFLENSDPVLDYPKAVFPNFIHVGGLTVKKPEPLPADIKQYLDESTEGVILVSFGSAITNVDQAIIENILAALQPFAPRVLFKHNKDVVKGKVKFMKWIPQNDILCHPNVKLFVSHCGKNGFWEGVFRGVPIICVPFGTDAMATGVKVKKQGIGAVIDVRKASRDDIYKVVDSVLGNKTIASRAKIISAILLDRTETPSQRAASALEHVIKYGSTHIVPPSVRMGSLTLIYADVWMLIVVTVLILGLCIVWLVTKCCRHSTKRKQD